MKKALIVLTGTLALIGTASAGKVDSTVTATVNNLCVYQTVSGPDVNTTDMKGADISLGTYRANAATTKNNASIITVLCNRGTTLQRNFPKTVNLKSNGSDDLVVKVEDSTLPYAAGTQNNPDTWNVEANLVAEAGQWGVKGGTYTGTLSVTLSYN